ncbi:MAG: triacylglycerol lipase [Peptococcaceae bacterium]|jgi:triacylglycerol lipase|nr:triacylglycerol lipase [Peptococcaceae bacterium]
MTGGINIIILKRGLTYLLLLLFCNIVLVAGALPGAAAILAAVALAVFYIRFNVIPRGDKSPQRRLRILIGGYELALAAITCFTFEILAYLYIILGPTNIAIPALTVNALISAGLIFILLFNGIARIFVCSGQLGIMPRVLLALFWWLPVVNLLLLRQFLSASSGEYEFTLQKRQLNAARRQDELCKTRYPLLLVHGIFFRDWENFNYWGRIARELTDNGAAIYYGKHQSSASVERCAGELKQCVLDILRETGQEKVNIIAHSKGGLDSRYAISCLGLGERVASLTTINTPHLGCEYVRKLLDAIPAKAVSAIGKGYESIYTKLGDDNPDFLNGLKNLTDQECARLNGVMPDHPAVLYQSVGSRMRSAASAVFPLSLGYSIIKLSGGGDNDGLVTTASMVWGDFLGVVSPKGRDGISHGDIIDLTRKNIKGFDVCEFYVDLVNKLKLKGL